MTVRSFSRWAFQRSAQFRWCAKVRGAVRVPIDFLHHRIAISITGAGCASGGVIHIPYLGAIGARKESALSLAKRRNYDDKKIALTRYDRVHSSRSHS